MNEGKGACLCRRGGARLLSFCVLPTQTTSLFSPPGIAARTLSTLPFPSCVLMRRSMTQAVQHLKNEMSKIRTGRANPGILEPIMVGCRGILGGQDMAGLKDFGARSRVGLGERGIKWGNNAWVVALHDLHFNAQPITVPFIPTILPHRPTTYLSRHLITHLLPPWAAGGWPA